MPRPGLAALTIDFEIIGKGSFGDEFCHIAELQLGDEVILLPCFQSFDSNVA